MKAKVLTLDNKAAGDIELDDGIFGVKARKDILHRVVEWQRAKARAGTHKVKTLSEVSGTTKKPYRQKGTGRARQGTLRAPHHEGGSKSHGPVVRTHAYQLPKRVRRLGLKMALSAKQQAGTLVVLDDVNLQDEKTKQVAASFHKLGLTKPLFVTGKSVDDNFARAARNIKGVDVLPVIGANVYDILRHNELVLTREAVEGLQERLS